MVDIGADERATLEVEIGTEDTEDIAGAEDGDMTEFEPVEGESAHELTREEVVLS